MAAHQLEVGFIEGPAYLAVALINGDESGFGVQEELDLEIFMNSLPEGAIIVDVSADVDYAIWNHLLTEVSTYTFHVHK
jgi:hypothetical protein